MTTTKRAIKASARSTKIRSSPCPDEGSASEEDWQQRFPPPTAWSEQLAVDNLKLAAAMASRMSRATRMPFEDLHLEATKGLLKGCRYFDPSRINPTSGKPYRLSTCVVPFIRGAMAQYLRDRGHSSGVKFPDRWRDKAPIVRRMASEGASLQAVMATTKLGEDEIEAILLSQGVTTQVEPDARGFATWDPDPWDEIETLDDLADALAIADLAHYFLREADRETLERNWDNPKRRQLVKNPHGQFLLKAKAIIRGKQAGKQPRMPKIKYGSQTSLMDVLEKAEALVASTRHGKTSSEGLVMVDGATSGNQPSN